MPKLIIDLLPEKSDWCNLLEFTRIEEGDNQGKDRVGFLKRIFVNQFHQVHKNILCGVLNFSKL